MTSPATYILIQVREKRSGLSANVVYVKSANATVYNFARADYSHTVTEAEISFDNKRTKNYNIHIYVIGCSAAKRNATK